MDTKLFEVLGKYGGLAGLSIGLILIICLAILRKSGGSAKPNPLLMQMMYLTFGIGIVGIAVWFFSRGETAITGRVSDIGTRDAIKDAEVILSGRPESAHSDGAGNFNLSLVGTRPQGIVHLYISKAGYEPYDRGVAAGQNIEAEMVPVPNAEVKAPPMAPAKPTVVTTEKYSTGEVASGACKDFGAWTTVCSPDKPADWTIGEQHFELTGDRAGCAYARCEPLGTITDKKACYHFQTQGHDEECGHSGNTGIHYSTGVLTVTWQHPE